MSSVSNKETTMNKHLILAVLASYILVACGKGSEEATAPAVDAQQPWAEFVATTIDEYYRRNPASAVNELIRKEYSTIPAPRLPEFQSTTD